MRHALIGTVILLGMALPVSAQEYPSSQTLDEQLSRVQNGQEPVSGNWTQPSTAAMSTAQPAGMDEYAPAAGEPMADPEMNTPAVTLAPVAVPMPAAAPSTSSEARAAAAAERKPVNAVMASAAAPMRKVTPSSVAPDGEIIQSEGGGAIPALPLSAQMNGNVKSITGGIGDEELAQLKSVEHEYNLRALLSTPQGEYISGAIVRLLAADGSTVAGSNDAGPYFYAAVPPGKYVLEVTSREAGIKKANVTVPASGFTKPHVVFAE